MINMKKEYVQPSIKVFEIHSVDMICQSAFYDMSDYVEEDPDEILLDQNHKYSPWESL